MSPAIRFRLLEEIGTSDLFWLTDERIDRSAPFCPASHGKPGVTSIGR